MEDRVYVFDTTLRDGEQSPGCSMNLEEKVRMAKQLGQLRVDVIEAGFPIASEGDFEAVRAIAQTVGSCTVAALARTVKTDIDRAWDAIRGAAKPRIHTFIATSDIHLARKLKKTREQVLSDVTWAVKYARSLCDDVEFSCEDASRSDLAYLCEVVAAAIRAGATVINLPDTVGYAVPEEYAAMFRNVRDLVPGIGGVVLSAHCHNDLGLSVANSLAAIRAGARQVECTMNGIGERAGNAALEEIVMAVKTRRERLGVFTQVNTEEIFKSSRLLSSLTGMLVQRNKAIVGANAFAHEAGIHQDGVLKSPLTYEIMSPQSVGIRHSTLVLGKHSGRHALKQRYAELGYDLSAEELERAYKTLCDIADQKKEIYDEDLVAILEDRVGDVEEFYCLENIQVHSGTNVLPTATVELRLGEQRFVDSATGDGPVDAAYRAIERITGSVGRLTEYSIKSVGHGHDAIGEVFVRAEFEGVLFNGRAVSTDVVTGSAKAFLEALNRALVARKRKSEQQNGEFRATTIAMWDLAVASTGLVFKPDHRMKPRTLFDKVWDAHVVVQETGAPAVLYIDLHLVHEVTSPQAFEGLRRRGLKVRRPDRTVATIDHVIPTHDPSLPISDRQAADQISELERNAQQFGFPLFGIGDPNRGIVHVVGPELGYTQPGMTIVCGDSHTSTHGAFGALAFGIGTSEVELALATQCLLQRKPRTFEVRVEGSLPRGVTAKDIILSLVSKIGVAGGAGYVFEYSGSAIRSLTMDERMTICNMSIEGGARAGMVAPDDTTFEYLAGREFSPKVEAWERSLARWKSLCTDGDARYDKSVTFEVRDLAPMITFGTNPGMGMPITDRVPSPSEMNDATERSALEKAIGYMGLRPGQSLLGTKIDVVFIGSCTNSRLSDLRLAATILKGRHVAPGVRVLVVPGSQRVKRQAEDEGLHHVFKNAGAEWRESGCSMCIAMNGDQLEPGEYAVSTSNRNFEGRQGKRGRTFLGSPLTAAAAAVTGTITDVRTMI